jgi:hypothetical protein
MSGNEPRAEAKIFWSPAIIASTGCLSLQESKMYDVEVASNGVTPKGRESRSTGSKFEVGGLTDCIRLILLLLQTELTLHISYIDVVGGPSTPHDPESDAGGSLSSWQGHPSR